jgi:carboxymethylenebutenolidase
MELVRIPPEGGPSSKVTPCPAYVFGRGSGRRRAVIVLHEWWGATPAVQKQAMEWFGEESLVVLLDLYRGQVASNVAEAAHLMHQLDFTQALRDIRAAAKWCRDKEQQCSKVGVIGFSMGGALALAAAVHLKADLQAAVVLYGIPDPRFASPAACRIPLQLHFGSADILPLFSDPKAADALEVALKESVLPPGVSHDFYRYPACGHSFAAPTGHTDPVERAAAGKVRERAVQFFVAKLV